MTARSETAVSAPVATGASFFLLVGALTMLPPLSIDISLPGLPAISHALHAPAGIMQWTLSAFVLAFGLGQLVLGPLSDRYGRRPVLIAGLAVFTLAGLGCAVVTEAHVLVALRFVQGLGACAGTVCARAIAQDVSTDRASGLRSQSYLSAVNAVAPIVAPLLGAAILQTMGWRPLYGVLAAIGAMLVLLVAARLPETSPQVSNDIGAAYRRVARLPRTAGLTIVSFASFFGYFAMIAGSPFALISQLHESSGIFALAFAVNAIALLCGSFTARQLTHRTDPERVLRYGIVALVAAGALAWGVDAFAPSAIGFTATMSLYGFTMGIVFPGTFAAALADAKNDAGLTSGILGSGQMLGGAFGSALAGLLPGAHAATIGTVALIGAAGSAIGYAASKPHR